MKARDVKCPKCGAAPSDVAPDHELGVDHDGLAPYASVSTLLRCSAGHYFNTVATAESFLVEALP